ncbi:fibronectin type III domain-containing protein [Capnocytophaga sputigena]|uniref:fibronectin type III domain-containing protein n=1 Tax=Capnocytophaga sputigena TaxID=1019 RepID=UPI0028F12155|nr:fibronectin type III domain-containing protein [Capnocytophaga sputigena]
MPLLRRYILLLLSLLSFTLQAQQYPVDVQVFVTPPYPQSLRGYADSFEQKIQAHFLLKDLSTGGRPFALRFSLEDFQGQTIAQTPDYITPYLVNLSPSVRRTLTNIDFKTLLRYENLYGINEATYNGLLPEGTYFIGLSLYDVATGRPVSNKGRAMIQVRRYSPPVLTMPQKGEVLTKKNAFQNILFQWMPRDIAPFMQYEFTLKEVWDLALVPEEAFMSGRLVYQTKTNAPALQYTNMMPILLENKRYVWQVRALTNNPANPNEQSYFRNNGNSETFYFDLVSNCEAPRMLTAMTESTSAQLRWSAQAMMPNQEYPYKVMYREKGKTWKSQKVSMPYAKVIGLKRGRTYIYKVGVACGLNAANSTSVFGEDSYVYST